MTDRGRPLKAGLDYFPVDVDYHVDPKFTRIRAQFGVLGEMIAIRFLSMIYREGYYIKWSKDIQYAISDQLNVKPNLVTDVTHALVRCNFFDDDSFNKHSVLTSKGIQRRWEFATSRRKTKPDKYWLLEKTSANDNNNGINVYNKSINANSNATIVKESKVKESKKSKERDTAARLRKKAKKKTAPPVNKPQKHKHGEFGNVLLTKNEHKKLRKRLNGGEKEYIDRLDGYIESRGRRYKSHYATILNWWRRDGESSKREETIHEVQDLPGITRL